jgi:cell division ATPase FtsA
VRRGRTQDLIVGLDVGTTKICAIIAAPRRRADCAAAWS